MNTPNIFSSKSQYWQVHKQSMGRLHKRNSYFRLTKKLGVVNKNLLTS